MTDRAPMGDRVRRIRAKARVLSRTFPGKHAWRNAPRTMWSFTTRQTATRTSTKFKTRKKGNCTMRTTKLWEDDAVNGRFQITGGCS
jgi:hypothetical protein